MDPFERVVVGIDGSAASEAAWRWVVDRLPAHGSATAVHVQDPRDTNRPSSVLASNTAPNPEFVDGDPADALATFAREQEATLIVVGAHGAGRHQTLGSVTRRLLKDSPTTILVVDGVDETQRRDGPVVAAVGYGEPAEAAARWAASYATSRGSSLVLLHALAFLPVYPLDSPIDMLGHVFGPELSEEWGRIELAAISDRLLTDFPELEISTHLKRGSAIRAVIEAGETAELVVLGSRPGEVFPHTLLTPHLARVVAKGEFPTAVVPTSPTEA